MVHIVLRKKGAELTELEEEVGDLMDRHQLMEDNVGTSERELIEKVGGGQSGHVTMFIGPMLCTGSLQREGRSIDIRSL